MTSDDVKKIDCNWQTDGICANEQEGTAGHFLLHWQKRNSMMLEFQLILGSVSDG